MAKPEKVRADPRPRCAGRKAIAGRAGPGWADGRPSRHPGRGYARIGSEGEDCSPPGSWNVRRCQARVLGRWAGGRGEPAKHRAGKGAHAGQGGSPLGGTGCDPQRGEALGPGVKVCGSGGLPNHDGRREPSGLSGRRGGGRAPQPLRLPLLLRLSLGPAGWAPGSRTCLFVDAAYGRAERG